MAPHQLLALVILLLSSAAFFQNLCDRNILLGTLLECRPVWKRYKQMTKVDDSKEKDLKTSYLGTQPKFQANILRPNRLQML